jgi:hypothetical protein
MNEFIEFRIPERHASRYLKPDQGERLGDSVRKLIVATDDPLLEKIQYFDNQLSIADENFYHGWDIFRKYNSRELKLAELFHININAIFEPAGEECGTVYDERTACVICGAGRKQVSDLFLDLRKTPKGKDIARTIADEWVITQKLAELLVDEEITGFELRPVHHKARYQDDPVDLKKVPSGRELLRKAKESGYTQDTWDFMVWANRTEQEELFSKARQEHAFLLEKQAANRIGPLPIWHQLVITSNPLPTIPPTLFKSRPFASEEEDSRFRCSLGHVSGLNLFSEVWVSKQYWDGSDFMQTEDMVGVRRGLLIPKPLLLISARLWNLFKAQKIRGFRADVAYFS